LSKTLAGCRCVALRLKQRQRFCRTKVQARFAAMQYRAPTPQEFAAPETGPTAPNDVLQSASEALDAQATEAATQAEDLRTGAQRALTAEDRGFGPESGVASEGSYR
jgi:hypothetical protein